MNLTLEDLKQFKRMDSPAADRNQASVLNVRAVKALIEALEKSQFVLEHYMTHPCKDCKRVAKSALLSKNKKGKK